MKRPRIREFMLIALGWGLPVLGLSPDCRGQSSGGRPPAPTDAVVTTKDGVQLKLTYYPSTAGKESVPIIMLHDYNETRAVFAPLALSLQNPPEPDAAAAPKIAPRAVVTVDLRGHGDSKGAVDPDGNAAELDAHRFKAEDFQNMVLYDMEAVRSFLVQQNDVGALNLNKLCVLGCGMGANVAVTFAARDWATPPLATRKQGQDVKALVLISPRWNYDGLALVQAMKFPPVQRQLAIFLAYGAEDRSVAKDCDNMRKIFDRFHPEPPADQVQLKKDYFLVAAPTRLQGTTLLGSREFGLEPRIASFIETRLGSRPYPWVQRLKP